MNFAMGVTRPSGGLKSRPHADDIRAPVRDGENGLRKLGKQAAAGEAVVSWTF